MVEQLPPRMQDPIRLRLQHQEITVVPDHRVGQLLKRVRVRYLFLVLRVALRAILIATLHRVVVVQVLMFLAVLDLVAPILIVYILDPLVHIALQFIKPQIQIILHQILQQQVSQFLRLQYLV